MKNINVLKFQGKNAAEELAIALCPKGLTPVLRAEWMRVATMLAQPGIERLKPHFVDAIMEYCHLTVRMKEIREFFEAGKGNLDNEIYTSETRNGEQIKNHPLVGQLNDAHSKWRALASDFGLTPRAERLMNEASPQEDEDPAAEFYGT